MELDKLWNIIAYEVTIHHRANDAVVPLIKTYISNSRIQINMFVDLQGAKTKINQMMQVNIKSIMRKIIRQKVGTKICFTKNGTKLMKRKFL